MKSNGLIRQLRRPIHYGKTLFTITRCKLLLLRWALQHGLRLKWIVTRPDVPSPHSAFYKICHRLGYRITTDAKRAGRSHHRVGRCDGAPGGSGSWMRWRRNIAF